MNELKEYTFKGISYTVEDDDTFHYKNEANSRERFLNVGAGDIFIDIGAYLGSWTIPAAMHGAKVLAIEPGHNRDQLRRNVERNKLLKNVYIYDALLSDWYYENIAYDSWSISRNPDSHGDWKTKPLDDILPRELVYGANFETPIRLIKIDVEGHELNVLRGGVNTLRKAENILTEVHTHLGIKTEEVIKFMSNVGKYKHEIVPQDGGQYHHVYFSKEESK
jgi:FkbM family methyltransferase